MSACLALTMGEPGGVGAEITIKAWQTLHASGPAFFYCGSAALVEVAAHALGLDVPVIKITEPAQARVAFDRGLPVIDSPLKDVVMPGAASPGHAGAVINAIYEMLGIATATRPHAVCLVPEKRQEVTTEGGLDAAGMIETLAPFVARLKEAEIKVSLFIDPEIAQVEAAARVGAPVVELHTGTYAENDGIEAELARLASAASRAAVLGIECHAGHRLTFGNVAPVAALPPISELNIGHFLVGEAVFLGLPAVIAEMKARIVAARHETGVSQ